MLVKYIILTLAIVLIQDVSTRQFNLKELRTSLSSPKTSFVRMLREDCEETGHTCLSCEVSKYCFELPNGDWITDEDDCEEKGLTCKESTGMCTSDANPSCDENITNYKFVCFQVGFFPHAFDCTKYHLCTANGGGTVIADPTIFTCPEGLQYDSLSTLCKKSLKERCIFIAETCSRVGESGPIPNNPNMYYTCLTVMIEGDPHLIPHFFNCLNGDNYIDGACRDPTPESVPLSDGKCTKSGSFFDSKDCKNYYDCVNGEEPESKTCSSGEYFDGLKSSCKPFECKQ